MHMIIYALVEVDENNDHPEDAALGAGKSVFDQLVGVGIYNDQVFDYYTTFDDDTSNVSGPSRYGEKPNALPVDDPAGARMLHYGWKYTKSEFERNMDKVREGLNRLTNEEIMEGEELIRHHMYSIGEYRGPSLYLYTEHGEGISRRSHLDRVLDNSENLWIVPADVHY